MEIVRAGLFAAVAVVAVMAGSSANANFLQTDPVGYKDDLDLYAYVKDDPLNHSDPSGLSCNTITAICKIDGAVPDGGASQSWMEKNPNKVKAATDSMTNTYRQLMHDPNKVNVVRGADGRSIIRDGRPVTITNHEMAGALAARGVFIDIKGTYRGSVQDSYAGTEFGGRRTFLEPAHFNSGSAQQMITYGHEAIHGQIELNKHLFPVPDHQTVYDNVVRHALWGPDN